MSRTNTINMRASGQEKALLQRAAEIAGFSNLTNFIMTAARQEATRVLSDSNVSYLSGKDFDRVNNLLAEPPLPNVALSDLLGQKKD
jgi:uncharacterized protein (DUF1778 family)